MSNLKNSPGRPLDPEPTAKQKEVLHFLIRYVEENGFQPTLKEIADALGIVLNSVQKRLEGLENKGYISRPTKRVERAIVLKYVKFKAYFEESPTIPRRKK